MIKEDSGADLRCGQSFRPDQNFSEQEEQIE
jgi:hypothetical protein